MTTSNPGEDSADKRRCVFCRDMPIDLTGPSEGWTDEQLARGRRETATGVEYHCYAGYCED